MSVDVAAVARLCRRTLTHDTRPVCWKLMLGYLPADRTRWAATEAMALAQYVDMVRTVCVFDEADVPPAVTAAAATRHSGNNDVDGDDGNNSSKATTWPSRRQQLRVIDMDVTRTMPDMAFFTTTPPPSAAASLAQQQHQQQEVEQQHEVDKEAEVLHACTAAVLQCDDDTRAFTHAQQALWRLLYTFARVNKGIGYVQGMNELAGHLLYAFAGGDARALSAYVEATAFFCLQTLFAYLGDHYCRALDYDANSGITSTLRHYEHVLAFVDPDVAAHLTALGIAPAHYALRWLTLLFTHEFATDAALRVWDVLLSCGDEIRNAAVLVAAALCHVQRDVLLAQPSLDRALPVLLGTAPHQQQQQQQEQQASRGDVRSDGDCGSGAHDAAAAAAHEQRVLRTVRRWLVLFDMRLLDALKTATPQRVDELRRDYVQRYSRHSSQQLRQPPRPHDDEDSRNAATSLQSDGDGGVRDMLNMALRNWMPM